MQNFLDLPSCLGFSFRNMDLNLVHLIFSLTLDGTIAKPYLLADLSRRFSGAFREVTCGRVSPCVICPDATGCPWFPLFGQQLSTDPVAVKRHQKPPLPFVFAVAPSPPDGAGADNLEIELILVGSAVNHAGSFIRAMERYCAGEREGGWTLDGVFSQGLFGERSTVWVTKRGDLSGDLRILSADDIAGKSECVRENVTLTFLTPLRQFREGRLLRTFDCSVFLRGLMRRISSLLSAYGSGEVEADFRRLAERSREIEVTRSVLHVVSGTDPITAGVVGSVCLSGDLAGFMPYLLLGEYLHAGKGASWGFGRFRIGDR